uniref:Lrp/AsnC family transcriptional regulator n=1 Tax=Klebsiella pneumoniae TaxID=573 RepID=UPI001F4BC2AA
MNDVLDEIDRAILTCLTQDARVSLKVLSARVGLTSPSTAERVKRLEERGVIQGYGARVNLVVVKFFWTRRSDGRVMHRRATGRQG